MCIPGGINMEIHQHASTNKPAGKPTIKPDCIQLVEYTPDMQKGLFEFLHKCMPESGRTFEPLGRHQAVTAISDTFLAFWCLTHEGKIIGCAAVKGLDPHTCELKMMYLYNSCQGMGFGRKLLTHAIQYASALGYQKMRLDTTRESRSAMCLYEKNGFYEITRYNHNQYADVFMQKDLC